jgi:hypothetical protein
MWKSNILIFNLKNKNEGVLITRNRESYEKILFLKDCKNENYNGNKSEIIIQGNEDYWEKWYKNSREDFINKVISKIDKNNRNLKVIPNSIFKGSIVDDLTIYVTSMIPKYNYFKSYIPSDTYSEE